MLFFFKFVSNVKHDKHTIIIMFNMLYYLINYEMWNISFLFEFENIIFKGGGCKSSLPLDIFASDIPYMKLFSIAFLLFAIAYM